MNEDTKELKALVVQIYAGMHEGVGPMARMSDGEICETINDKMSDLFGNDWRAKTRQPNGDKP